MFPFYALHSAHPRNPALAAAGATTPPDSPATHKHALVRRSLEAARSRMLALSNTTTSAGPTYSPGQQVLLNADNIKTNRACKKLDDRFMGLFTIDKVLGTHNVRLAMPGSSIHPMFHINRVKPYLPPESFPGCPELPRPPPVVNSKYVVSKILNSRIQRGKALYFVEWDGWGLQDRQWVAASDFDHNDEVMLSFARNNPTLPVHGPRGQVLLHSSDSKPVRKLRRLKSSIDSQ